MESSMYFPRTLEKKLSASLNNHKISIVLGPRQSGKTTLLKRIYDELDSARLFVDLDIYENRLTWSTYNEIIKYLQFNGYRRDKSFVLFLDEFQGVKNIDIILKNLYDHEPNLKIIATGSSSLAVMQQLKESLAGRKQILYLFPLSFNEFINFRDADAGKKIKQHEIAKLPNVVKNKLNNYVKEFCLYGGYPEVVLFDAPDNKKEIIRSIFDLYVKKDLIGLLDIKNPEAAFNILRYLAINMGGIINYSQLCADQNININTLKRYINILNETFVVKTIHPFFVNKSKEIVRAPKIYFIDPGVRNYFLKNFSDFDSRTDNSFLIENFIFSQFFKKSDFLTEIKFWRDKNGREVDFVIERENQLDVYEVKYRKSLTKKMLSNLIFFNESYPRANAHVINIVKPALDIKTIDELEYFEV